MKRRTEPHAILATLLGATALWLAAAAPATAASPFDGNYAGESSRVQGRESVCSNTHRIRVQVVDGSFTITWNRTKNIDLLVSIANDGSVSGSKQFGRGAARVSATGTAKPGSLEVDLKGEECSRHLSLKKV